MLPVSDAAVLHSSRACTSHLFCPSVVLCFGCLPCSVTNTEDGKIAIRIQCGRIVCTSKEALATIYTNRYSCALPTKAPHRCCPLTAPCRRSLAFMCRGATGDSCASLDDAECAMQVSKDVTEAMTALTLLLHPALLGLFLFPWHVTGWGSGIQATGRLNFAVSGH